MDPNSSTSCPGLEVLDFRPHYPCYNLTDTHLCEEEWPCELRLYWLELHTFVDITRAFLSYGSAIIIFFGVILNGLSFYILVSSGLAKNGSGIYLLTLAVCDSGNLLVNIGIGVWRGASYDFNEIFMEHEWLCRLHGVFVEIFQTVSAWIVVAFTVERCLAVWYPMMLRHSRNHRSKIVVAGLTSIFSLFCLSKLFLTGFEKDSVFGYIPCNSHRFVWQGMAYVRVAFQTWIPTIIVFLFNCLMFWKLRRIKSNRKKLTAYRRNREQSRIVNGHSRKPSFINKPSPTNPMLIAVSLAYLVLVLPLGTVQTVELYWNVHKKVPISTVGDDRLRYISWMMTRILVKYIRSFCFGFYQLNFAINFFLYFAAGVEFRVHLQFKLKQLSCLLKTYCCCRKTEVKDPRQYSQHRHPRHQNSSLANSMSVAEASKNTSTKTVLSNAPSLGGIINDGFDKEETTPGTPSSNVHPRTVKKVASIRFSLDLDDTVQSSHEIPSPVLSNHSPNSASSENSPHGSDQIQDSKNNEDEFYDAIEMTDYQLDEPGEFIYHKSIPSIHSASS